MNLLKMLFGKKTKNKVQLKQRVFIDLNIFKSIANEYHGTDNYDIAGLWETKIFKYNERFNKN